MEQNPPQSELHRRFDELTANPDGIEEFEHELLTPAEFAAVFRKAAQQFTHNLELANLQPPRSSYAVQEYTNAELFLMQERQRYTWGDMMAFLEDWEWDQLGQIDIQETS